MLYSSCISAHKECLSWCTDSDKGVRDFFWPAPADSSESTVQEFAVQPPVKQDSAKHVTAPADLYFQGVHY